MNGEPWNTPLRQEEKLQIQDRECISLEQQHKCGGQKECMTCCGHNGSNSRELRRRSQDTVNSEVAQRDSASSNVSPGKTSYSLSNCSKAQAVTQRWLRVDPREHSHMAVAAVAEGSTTQSTSATIRVVETEGQSNTECQRVLASRSDLHGTIADMGTYRAIVMTTDPERCDGRTQQVEDWIKVCCGAKSGRLGHFESQKVSERRIKELANNE